MSNSTSPLFGLFSLRENQREKLELSLATSFIVLPQNYSRQPPRKAVPLFVVQG
jgi:hypothetical protein